LIAPDGICLAIWSCISKEYPDEGYSYYWLCFGTLLSSQRTRAHRIQSPFSGGFLSGLVFESLASPFSLCQIGRFGFSEATQTRFAFNFAWFRSYLSGFPGVKSGSFSDPGQHVRPFIYFWGFDAVRLYSARFAVSTARSGGLACDLEKVTHGLDQSQIAWSAGCLMGTDGAGAAGLAPTGRGRSHRVMERSPSIARTIWSGEAAWRVATGTRS
jgi:hypothetical protein